jgi:uncharacterized membrane protein YecN with MAPEG domain
MRIAQAVLAPVTRAAWREVEELPDSARGAGGFGARDGVARLGGDVETGASMDLVIVPYYAASLALIFVFLSGHVDKGRREQKVAIGAPRAGDLERRVRVHANFAEYTPFALVLIAMAEIRGAPPYVLHTVCLALLLGRVCHAWGVSQADEDFRFRAAGTAMTLAAIVGAALELVMGRGTRDGEGACSTCGASAALPISAAMDLDFTDAELHRYSRHILLAEVGAEGQARLRAARVLVVGAGGLARRSRSTWPRPASARSASWTTTGWSCPTSSGRWSTAPPASAATRPRARPRRSTR